MSVATLPLKAEQPDANSFQRLRELAIEIRHTSRDAAATLTLIGRKLQDVKTAYPQYFDAWVRTELQWPIRLVSQYLRIAAAFGDIDWSNVQADPQALMVLTTQYTAGNEQAIRTAREVLQSGELLTEQRAKNIKHYANKEAHEARRPPQRQQYIPAYPLTHRHGQDDTWVTLPEIRTAVMNLQVALIEVYGDHLYPQVRRALDQLQALIGRDDMRQP